MENLTNKAIFLDRDDTIIEDSGYINNPDQVKLISGVAKSLLEFKEMGFKLIVVTNQSGVARGILTEKTLGEIHERINVLLSEKGVVLDGFYYCPFHPEGIVPQYRRESDSRKPNPGMILIAAEEHNIDLNQSWVIGNDSRDIDAGKRAGCKTILIETKSRTSPLLTFRKEEQPEPDFRAVNMKEAVNIVKRHYRQLEQQQKIESPGRLERPRYRTSPPPAPTPPPRPAPASAVAQPQPVQEPLPMPARTSRRSRPVSAEPPAEPAKMEEIEEKEEQQTPEQLLGNILRELQSMRRSEGYGEFSIIRLLAGLLQVIVFFCLLVSIWLTMEPARKSDLILITLGFAMVLQLIALTFYLMQARK
jgi:D-glycero-D-manno-heptose 1,7-bisphosphate phosphatase